MVFALLALVCLISLAVVIWPLVGRASGRSSTGQASEAALIGDEKNLQVYRDQLEEIERDQQRGVLPEDQAEAARLEVKRRLLALPSDLTARGKAKPPLMAPWVAHTGLAVGLLLVILGTLGFYARFGNPFMPTLGYEARVIAAKDAETNDHAARLRYLEIRTKDETLPAEQRLDLNRELARRYIAGGEVIEGLEAMRAATEIAPENADLWAEFGEIIFSLGMSQGVIPPAARQAIGRSLQLDPNNPRGLFVSSLILTEEGLYDQAIGLLRTLRAQVPDIEPLALAVDQRIRDVEELAKQAAAGGTISDAPGPSAEDVQAAQQMSSDDRNAMIEGMVQRLADRLAEEPDDMDGWARLANAYMVLGRLDDARQALEKLPQDHPQRAGLADRLDAAGQASGQE